MTAIDINAWLEQFQHENGSNFYGTGSFWKEFELLQQQELRQSFSRRVGQRQKNRIKNRYSNILPSDHSRANLFDTNNKEPGADYSNANYIKQTLDFSKKVDSVSLCDMTGPVMPRKIIRAIVTARSAELLGVDDWGLLVYDLAGECARHRDDNQRQPNLARQNSKRSSRTKVIKFHKVKQSSHKPSTIHATWTSSSLEERRWTEDPAIPFPSVARSWYFSRPGLPVEFSANATAIFKSTNSSGAVRPVARTIDAAPVVATTRTPSKSCLFHRSYCHFRVETARVTRLCQ